MLHLPCIQPIYERTIAETGINPDEVKREILRGTGDPMVRLQDMIDKIFDTFMRLGGFG